jgi:FlaA1/EpsC-like NDP-sugar epimerase
LTVLADQMARERAITVTHPDVTRFFMTVEEAVGLVLEAVTMARYAETFVLDMGEPVAILDLVKKYAAAVNVSNVEIQFTGLRPGEKLNEVVFSDTEERKPTVHPKIWSTTAPELGPDFQAQLEQLYALSAVNDVEATLKLLRQMVPEYEPTQHEPAPTAARAPYPDGF